MKDTKRKQLLNLYIQDSEYAELELIIVAFYAERRRLVTAWMGTIYSTLP